MKTDAPLCATDAAETQARRTGGGKEAFSLPPLAGAAAVGLIVVLVLIFGARLAGIFAPESFRDLRAIPSEDGYCYFLIGRNIAEGRGMTADGARPTNGIHPLWQILNAGAFWLIGPFAPTAMLVFAALLDALTALIIFFLARRIARSDAAGILAAAIYGFSYQSIFFNALNGSDTAISVFFFTAFFAAYVMMAEKSGAGRTALFGILGGLAFLSRTDNVFLLVVAYAALFIFSLKGGERFTRLLAAGAITVAVASPWLVYNQVKFGSIVQQSAVTNSYVFHEVFRMEHGSGLPVFTHSLRLVGETLIDQLPRMSGLSYGSFAIFIAFIIIAALRRSDVSMREAAARMKPLLAPAIALLLLIIVHSGFRWLGRRNYLQRSTPVWAVFISAAAAIFFARAKRPGFIIGAIITPLVSLVLLGHSAYRLREPSQIQLFQYLLLQCGKYVRENVPRGSIIAMHVSGSLISYASGRDAIDLSGNVNPDMFEVYKSRRMTAYLRENRVEYLISGVGGIDMLEKFSKDDPLAPHAAEKAVFKPPVEYEYLVKKEKMFFPAIYRLKWE